MLQHLKYWLALRSCGIHYTVGVWKCMGNDSVPQLMKSSVWKLQTCLCFWQQYALNIYFMTQFFWWVFTIFNSCSCLVADRLIYLCVFMCFLWLLYICIWNIMLSCRDVRYQAVAYIEASAYIYQDGKVRLNSWRLLCAEIRVLVWSSPVLKQ